MELIAFIRLEPVLRMCGAEPLCLKSLYWVVISTGCHYHFVTLFFETYKRCFLNFMQVFFGPVREKKIIRQDAFVSIRLNNTRVFTFSNRSEIFAEVVLWAHCPSPVASTVSAFRTALTASRPG